MINYIICLDNKNEVQLYKKIIHKLMNSMNLIYKIYFFSSFEVKSNQSIFKNICGKKIYIFDSNIDMLAYAKNIRNLGDVNSQIIVILNKEIDKNFNLIRNRKLYSLDIIFKDNNFINTLEIYLDVDISILNRDKTLCFKYNNEIFHILYNDIYYIEKNLHNNDSTIVTKDNEYIINFSINRLMEVLEKDYRFFKSHRSCIVNLDNIVSFDISNKTIKFKDTEINLVSRDKKRELKERLNRRYQKQ